MSNNIVLTARKGIGWAGERGEMKGVCSLRETPKVKENRAVRTGFEPTTRFEALLLTGRCPGRVNRKRPAAAGAHRDVALVASISCKVFLNQTP